MFFAYKFYNTNLHIFRVTGTVCWFLYNEEVRDLIENNFEYFSGVLLNVYRATDLMFPTEFELQEARTFARKLIEKSNSLGEGDHRNPFCKLVINLLFLGNYIISASHL